MYYEQYYKGPVMQQYDLNYYEQRTANYNPDRATRPHHGPIRRGKAPPKVYRGPRAYRTPTKTPELQPSTSNDLRRKLDSSREGLTPIAGVVSPSKDLRWKLDSSREGLTPTAGVLSPPQRLFSPEGRRRSSRRFQPY